MVLCNFLVDLVSTILLNPRHNAHTFLLQRLAQAQQWWLIEGAECGLLLEARFVKGTRRERCSSGGIGAEWAQDVG